MENDELAEQVCDNKGIKENFETKSANYDEYRAVIAEIMDRNDQAEIVKDNSNAE